MISACPSGCLRPEDGASTAHPLAEALARRYELVPVCPEQLGGLPTPRPPAERRGDRVVTRTEDVTEAYHRGAEEAWRLCSLLDCRAAVLKERSPSCGHGAIYDGTFSGCLTEGSGVTAQLLEEQGIPVYGESQIAELLK